MHRARAAAPGKRRCEHDHGAQDEKRRCRELQDKLAECQERLEEYKRREEEAKRREQESESRETLAARKLEAAQKKLEIYMNKYHNRHRSMTKWRLRAHRAKSALRALSVTGKDGNSTRARSVLVQKGGTRRAIQRQVIVESGSLQIRQGGVGGTEYTVRERLLAWRQDRDRGIGSRHDRSSRYNEDRSNRAQEAAVVMQARKGRRSRRNDSADAVDVFVTPGELAMMETRQALHLEAACKMLEESRSAVAINISADGKQFGQYSTLGAYVEIVNSVDGNECPDAFGNRRKVYASNVFRTPIMLNAGKAVKIKSLLRRKDGGQYNPQTAETLAIMLMLSGVDRAINSNSGALRMACDGATDNRGI
jgi:hypothetical protein